MYTMMTDNRKRNIRYLAFDSKRSNVAEIKVYEQCNLLQVAPSCDEYLDCEENFRCVSGTCEECPEGTKAYNGNCQKVCLKDDDCAGNSICNIGVSVCDACPAGTAPRIGSCDETCSATDACSDPDHACENGFCTPCLVNEIVQASACVSICELKKNEGMCSNKKSKWFYKAGQNICVEMQGCDEGVGTSNTFPSKTDCQEVCRPKTVPPECFLETDAGNCEDYQVRYHYSPEKMACKKFSYNGCDGNENNFSSKEACRLHCAKYD
ncbi:hypothetical protein CAPTEDRAFT_154579 [Capitella teleta]|uniref:BPTI/Kunitz inhibitor domain-containing protein n=1 Tax=Capitella teleta TaxID=283909 RepID=R7UC68_CAPTE|nr:hypothetical protein CAPTEDRAFT_154579 [Capitella teleta]|eukprot:ELU03945.1 hypothetical protein CAPTEDRAFT_154579 [Capitella teleta]